DLLNRISQVLDQVQPGTTTRSRPAFVTSGSTLAGGTGQQFELNAGFAVGNATTPWTGKLYRQRFQCDASLVAQPQPIATQDSFHDLLNARSTARRLLTVVTPNANDMTGNL